MARTANGAHIAEVVALTAEVRALMVGSRQITLSVYRQLDTVASEHVEPFGRVRDGHDKECESDLRRGILDDTNRGHDTRFRKDEIAQVRHTEYGRVWWRCEETYSHVFVVGRDERNGALVRASTWRTEHRTFLSASEYTWPRQAMRVWHGSEHHGRWDEWRALPLIVLAGLR
jgi:hypothetical protein